MAEERKNAEKAPNENEQQPEPGTYGHGAYGEGPYGGPAENEAPTEEEG